ncbi:MAG: BON domain-containing protein [Actinomycetota bacterium]|nr:BON domain-containing protein [Actinomycetota bacterium]
MPTLMLAGAVGAAIAYFFDPQNGRRRRKLTLDRAGALLRSTSHQAAEKPPPDDVTLARKVETEIFRDAEVPKGQINVNVEHGVVFLRGELGEPDLIKDLEQQARKVHGVLGVENLLHTPGQEAPAKPK